MRNAVLLRGESSSQGTKGWLITDLGWSCCTLELPWLGNQPNISCVKSGSYKVWLYNSPRFGQTYRLTDSYGRTYVLMHAGNFAGDKALGYKTHVEGCILLGKYHGKLDYNGRPQLAVLSSRPTVREFVEHMRGESFMLNITGDFDA